MSYEAELLSGTASIIIALTSFFAVVFIVGLLSGSKSKRYREYLTNMLVAGKVRQLAEKEKVDLIKEDAFFTTYCKKTGLDRMAKIDEILEDQLADKLEEDKKHK